MTDDGIIRKKTPARGKLVFFLFGLSFVHGLALNLMPVLFPTIGAAFQVPKAQQGLLQTAFSIGTISALIIAGYLTNWLGAKRVVTVAIPLAGLGAFMFGLAGTFVLVLGAAMLLGMGMSALTAAYAAIITAKFADISQRMYMLTFSVLAGSATLSTSLIGGLVEHFQYPSVFIAFGLFLWVWIALLLVVAGSALDWEVGRAHLEANLSPSESVTSRPRASFIFRFFAKGVLNRGVLYILGVVVILDTIASGSFIAWTPTYFGETYKLTNIGLVLSANSAGVFVGRLLLAALPSGFITDRVLLGICYAGAMVSFGLILVTHPGMYVALALIALAGAFISAQAPTTYSIATSKFGKRAPAAIPLIDAMGNLGGLAAPPLLGFLADRSGDMEAVMWLIPISGFALVAVVLIWEFVDRPPTVRLVERGP